MPGRLSFEDSIRQHQQCVEAMHGQLADLYDIAEAITAALAKGHTLYLCGNGGSAADCQHVAGEFVGRFLRERKAYPAVALTTDSSILTAVGNDYGFDQIFSRQVQALAKPGDIVCGISTSGKSPNVLAAIEMTKSLNVKTLAFTGHGGNPLAAMCDLAFRAPATHTPRIQELHLLAWHLLCDRVEESLVHA